MKLSFFVAAMLGFTATNVSAVRMFSMPDTLAEIEADDTIKVNVPECQAKPDPEALIMEAVKDMGCRANELKQAIAINAANKCKPVVMPCNTCNSCVSSCNSCSNGGNGDLLAKLLGVNTCGSCNTCNTCNTCDTCNKCDPCAKCKTCEERNEKKEEKKEEAK